jgi:hypothetical protein
MKKYMMFMVQAMVLCYAKHHLAMDIRNETRFDVIIVTSQLHGPFGWAGYYTESLHESTLRPGETAYYSLSLSSIRIVMPDGIREFQAPSVPRNSDIIISWESNRPIFIPVRLSRPVVQLLLQPPETAHYLGRLPRELRNLLLGFLSVNSLPGAHL